MTVIGWHGDPCSRCPESRSGQQPRAATLHGMCALCWLGATERQRRAALFDEGMDAVDVRGVMEANRAASEVRWLESMLSLPGPPTSAAGDMAEVRTIRATAAQLLPHDAVRFPDVDGHVWATVCRVMSTAGGGVEVLFSDGDEGSGYRLFAADRVLVVRRGRPGEAA